MLFESQRVFICESSAKQMETLHGLLEQGGATVLSSPHDTSLTIVVAPSMSQVPEDMSSFRCRRIPVVVPPWVMESAACGRLMPLTSARYAQFNPKMFAGVVATTSQLPTHVRQNLRAAIEFFGGVYSPTLTKHCTLVITSGSESEKVRVAAQVPGMHFESVAWVQRCLDLGMLCPFTKPDVAEVVMTSPFASISQLYAKADAERPRKRQREQQLTVVIDLPSPAQSSRPVTRRFAQVMKSTKEIQDVRASGPITRSKAAVLQQLLQRLSPEKKAQVSSW